MNRRSFPLAAIALVLAGLLGGCSERPLPHNIAWHLATGMETRRASLSSVVAWSADQAVAIGFDRPEGLIANVPLSLALGPGGWRLSPIATPTDGGSVQLNGACLAGDGSVWTCGRSVDYEPEPSRSVPLVYRRAAGVWAQVALPGLEALTSTQLLAIASAGPGPSAELRAVGSTDWGLAGVAVRFAGGSWRVDSLPTPPGAPPYWDLDAIARSPDERWYAAGWSPSGAVIYRDDGSGWKSIPAPPGRPGLRITAIGFDPQGVGWFAGNEMIGDSLVGTLFRYQGGSFVPVTIVRKTPGECWLNAISFDVEGHGWVAGGRSGNQPFLAGTSGGDWREALAQIENDLPQGPGPVTGGGGQLFSVSVVGAEIGFAVGYLVELDPKGLYESEANIYQLTPLPPGEIDSWAPPPMAPR